VEHKAVEEGNLKGGVVVRTENKLLDDILDKKK
jgi:hypothetical protein